MLVVQLLIFSQPKRTCGYYKIKDMKTYDVLCKTCGGSGTISNTDPQTTSATEICPVCKGNKTQKVHETSYRLTFLGDTLHSLK